MPGTLVFIPAWNEEASLPAVITDARTMLPDTDVLVILDADGQHLAEELARMLELVRSGECDARSG